MNQQIKIRTQKKLQQSEKAHQHQWTFYNHQYQVLSQIFSPAIFMGTKWLTQTILQYLQNPLQFLQIGSGCGVTSIQIALKYPNCKITACDINPKAVQNTQLNAKKFQTNIQVVQSDNLNKFEQKNFDVIYWNYPFHPTNKKLCELTMLQKAIMDPNYDMFRLYLSKARKYLKQKGYLLLGFSYTMGDIQLLNKICKQYQWNIKQIKRMEIQQGSMCLYKLN